MAIHQSVIKRARQSEKARRRNQRYKSAMKTSIKKLLSTTDKEAAENTLRNTVSLLDKMVTKGIIHKNNAANKKSRLSKFMNSL
ncbi:MAG: 30S ribosomal protein S20 [bacterium]